MYQIRPPQETAAGFFMHTSKEKPSMNRKTKIVADGPLIFSEDYGIISRAWSSWNRSRAMTENEKPEEWKGMAHCGA